MVIESDSQKLGISKKLYLKDNRRPEWASGKGHVSLQKKDLNCPILSEFYLAMACCSVQLCYTTAPHTLCRRSITRLSWSSVLPLETAFVTGRSVLLMQSFLAQEEHPITEEVSNDRTVFCKKNLDIIHCVWPLNVILLFAVQEPITCLF